MATPRPACRCGCDKNSKPRSKVMERRAWNGRGESPEIIPSIPGFDLRSVFFNSRVERLTLSTNDVTLA